MQMKRTRERARVGDYFTFHINEKDHSLWNMFFCALGVIVILVTIVSNAAPYVQREKRSRYNDAAAAYNQLSRAERELLFDELFDLDSSQTRSFDKEEYLFSTVKVAESLFDRVVIESVISGCIAASLIASLVIVIYYFILCALRDKAFFLADLMMPFPYSLPWILMLFVLWPFLVVSVVRLYRFQKSHTAGDNPERPEIMEASTETMGA